jgi:hypothetical protein
MNRHAAAEAECAAAIPTREVAHTAASVVMADGRGAHYQAAVTIPASLSPAAEDTGSGAQSRFVIPCRVAGYRDLGEQGGGCGNWGAGGRSRWSGGAVSTAEAAIGVVTVTARRAEERGEEDG